MNPMRLYDNPWLAITYLLGKGTQSAKNKIQNTIDERDKKKELESAINYFSSNEEEHKRRNKIAKKLEKCAIISFIICLLGILCLFVFVFFLPPPIFLIILTILMALSIIYGLWYSFWGKYL